MDQRVTFQRLTRSSDTQGGGSATWAAISGLSNIPAAIEALNVAGSEARLADQTTATHRWRLTIRYSDTAAGLTPKDRALWGSRYVQIESVRPGGSRLREFLEISGSERTS